MSQNYEMTDRVLQCPKCGNKIGQIVKVDGRVHVLHGNIVARSFYHHCPVDGRKFYFDGRSEDDREQKAVLAIASAR